MIICQIFVPKMHKMHAKLTFQNPAKLAPANVFVTPDSDLVPVKTQ